MLSPNSLPGQFPDKHTHFKRYEEALLSRHGSLDFELDSLRRRAGTGHGHGQDVITRCAVRNSLLAPEHRVLSYPPADVTDEDKRLGWGCDPVGAARRPATR